MNIRHLAKRNIEGNAKRYLAYFLSCIFAVTIFYMYAAFIFHPDVIEGEMKGAAVTRRGMIAAEIIIIIFSVFFISYSNGAFLQTRKKEFGLLTLFGMSKGQLRKLIYFEQTIVSILAIVVGVGLGLLFSKLFLMLMSALLSVDSPIEFMLVPEAFLYTIGGFFILFQLLTLLGLFKVGKQEPIDLLKEASKPKNTPLFSYWLVLLTVVCLSITYYLAATIAMLNVFGRILPILFFVLVGTYFLFTQGSVAVMKSIYGKKSRLYRGTNLVTDTNMLFHVRDFSKMFFLTSVITAVILTAAGTIFMFYADLKDQSERNMPQAIGWVENNAEQHSIIEPDKVRKTLNDGGFEILYEVDIVGVPVSHFMENVTGERVEGEALLLPESEINRILEKRGFATIELRDNQAVYNYPYEYLEYDFFEKDEHLEIQVQNLTEEVVIIEQLNKGVIAPIGIATSSIIVRDQLYEQISNEVPLSNKARVHGFEMDNWEQAIEVSEMIEAEANLDGAEHQLQTRATGFQSIKQGSALTLFIGLFVSLLFFIVQGSMIYLKLFTTIEDKKMQIYSLFRVGLTRKEIRKILNHEVAMLFFIPFVIGTVHALFAYIALSNLLAANLTRYAALVIGIYFILQLSYYLITRKLYAKSVTNDIRYTN